MTDTAPDYLAMTDFRALCAELLEIIDFLCEGDSRPDCDIVARARAYLAQPEPEGPTDEELNTMLYYEFTTSTGHGERSDPIGFARAVLARWPRAAIEPVPVSERPILKSSNFNDANGHCWCGTRASIDRTGDLPVKMPSSWELREPCAQDDCVLPHHALPVPAATEKP